MDVQTTTLARRAARRIKKEQDRRWRRWQLVAAIRAAIPARVAHRLTRELVSARLPWVALAVDELHRALDAAAGALREAEN